MDEQQQIDGMVKRVKELTTLALSGPAGLEEVAARLWPPLNIYNSECGVMRGIAERVFPANYEFQIMATVSGECHLVVTGIR